MSPRQEESDDVARPQGASDKVVEATSPTPPMMSSELQASILVAYRSVGLGLFGASMRFAGMPLEKIALFMNSSQVTGKNQFAQSIKLTFREGPLAPFRVVGPASLTAWFMAYSVMGLAFQTVDQALSKSLGVAPVCYGKELMEPPPSKEQEEALNENVDASYRAKYLAKTILAPILAGSLESLTANRAEVQRYFGPRTFSAIEGKLGWNPVARLFAPAYAPNVMRNVIMCNTSFIITPIAYKLYYPQEKKSTGSLFCFGMGMNFAGNAVAITQQALWGRALDYAAVNGGRNINYSEVIRSSLKKEGMAAFITVPKWFSRVLMNAPVQGSLPWFYNNILPLGEGKVIEVARWVTSSSANYATEGNHQTRSIS